MGFVTAHERMDAKLRQAIALEAARLMYERLESEYYTAKRKAAKRLCRRGVGENVNVDVGAFADVAGHHAADQSRPERAENAHQAQRFQTHVAQIGSAFFAFVNAGEDLDLVA